VRRDRFDIMAEILRVASEETGRTALAHRANLHFGTMDKYLAVLSGSGLVSVANSPVRVRRTPKGDRFLRLYARLRNLLGRPLPQGKG